MLKSNSTILILGVNGLLGSSIAKQIAEKKCQIVGVDIAPKVGLFLGQSTIKDFKYIQGNITKKQYLRKLISDIKPDCIVNAVNLATIFSLDEAGLDKLADLYIDLYEGMHLLPKVPSYLQCGTTGSGGLGINIPFTHGQALNSKPIIKKASYAGAISMLQVLLSRSFGEKRPLISEIKPGGALFIRDLVEDNFENICFYTVNGGESGCYSYNELSLLTSYMQYISLDRVVMEIVNIIDGNTVLTNNVGSDVTLAMNSAIIQSNKSDIQELGDLKSKLKDDYLIATGNLGPSEITYKLLEITKFLAEINSSQELLKKYEFNLRYLKTKKPDLYSEITNIKIIVKDEIIGLNLKDIKKFEAWEILKMIIDKSL